MIEKKLDPLVVNAFTLYQQMLSTALRTDWDSIVQVISSLSRSTSVSYLIEDFVVLNLGEAFEFLVVGVGVLEDPLLVHDLKKNPLNHLLVSL